MSATQLYDTQVIAAQKLLGELNMTKSNSRQNLDVLEREIIERFSKINLRVTVAWFTDNEPVPTYFPQVTVEGELEDKAFDHDQMRHEIVNDVRQTGQGGLIKPTRADIDAMMGRGQKHRH